MRILPLSRIAWAGVLLGVLAAVVACAGRARVERANHTVAIVVPWEDVQLLHSATQQPYAELLQALGQAGATTIGVREDTSSTLIAEGMLQVDAGESGTTFITRDQELATRMARFLESKMPGRVRLRGTRVRVEGVIFDERLANSGVGLPPWICRRVTAARLGILARPSNDPLHNRESLAILLTQLSSLGAWALVPEGAEVLGYDDLAKAVAQALNKAGIKTCSIEFASQFGDQTLGRVLKGDLLRLHSITTQEMETMRPAEARDRFVRAVRERNVRVCYARLFCRPSQAIYSRNLAYLGALKSGLERAGYKLGLPTPYPDLGTNLALAVLMAIGIWSAVVLILGTMRLVSWRLTMVLGLAGWLLSATVLAAQPLLARKLLALLSAVAFPTLAMMAITRSESPWRRVGGPAWGLAAATAVSLCGGLTIGGLLYSRTFLVTVDLFSGVKVALVTPVLLVFLWLVMREALLAPHDNLADAGREWRLFVEQPLRVKHLLIALVVAVVAALWLLRSGNVSEAATLPLERPFRLIMERVFGSRPRSKEFLFGHPLLLLGLWLWVRAARANTHTNATAAAKVLLLLGTVGQVSVVNSFCHLHSPISLTLLRVLHGLWLGALVGAVAVVVVRALLGRTRAPATPSSAVPG
jgi:hypothetical protein